MVRFATAVAASVVVLAAVSTSAVSAVDSSLCPPVTSVKLTHVSAKTYKMQISARNTCSCRIRFQYCSHNKPRPDRCGNGWIRPGETKQFSVTTTVADGKAHYHWRCG
jgi:hypothetical protein